jgi:hypothetical protein
MTIGSHVCYLHTQLHMQLLTATTLQATMTTSTAISHRLFSRTYRLPSSSLSGSCNLRMHLPSGSPLAGCRIKTLKPTLMTMVCIYPVSAHGSTTSVPCDTTVISGDNRWSTKARATLVQAGERYQSRANNTHFDTQRPVNVHVTEKGRLPVKTHLTQPGHQLCLSQQFPVYNPCQLCAHHLMASVPV